MVRGKPHYSEGWHYDRRMKLRSKTKSADVNGRHVLGKLTKKLLGLDKKKKGRKKK